MDARGLRSPIKEDLVHSSRLFTLTVGARALAGSTATDPRVPAPAASSPAPGR